MTTCNRFILAGSVAAVIFTTAPALFAQSAAETLQQKVGLPQEVAPPTPPVTSTQDLGQVGIVQKFPKPEMFTLSTTQQYFHTDNVFYTQAAPVSSSAYLGTYTASIVPYSFVNWTPRISLQYNMARYGNAAAGDFDNENMAFSSQYIFTKDRMWSWTSTVNLSRFTTVHGPSGVFYKEVVYDNQISHVMPIGKNNNLFFVAAYDLAYHQASPSMFDRLDNTLSFSLAYYPCRSVCIGPYVRPGARIYTTDTAFQNGRDDFNISEGLDVTWQPCKYLAISADISSQNDFSNTANVSYNVVSPGISATGTYKF